MSISQAQPWNVRTCRPDVKRESQVVMSNERKSSDAGHRGGVIRSSVEAAVMAVERRDDPIQLACLEQLEPGGFQP